MADPTLSSNPAAFPMMTRQSISGPALPWYLAEIVYEAYARLYGREQSLERLSQRGGFGWGEVAIIFDDLERRDRTLWAALLTRASNGVPPIETPAIDPRCAVGCYLHTTRANKGLAEPSNAPETSAALPDQLLDVNAICNQRDHLLGLVIVAGELLNTAPLHCHGKAYEDWRGARTRWMAERNAPSTACAHMSAFAWDEGDGITLIRCNCGYEGPLPALETSGVCCQRALETGGRRHEPKCGRGPL